MCCPCVGGESGVTKPSRSFFSPFKTGWSEEISPFSLTSQFQPLLKAIFCESLHPDAKRQDFVVSQDQESVWVLMPIISWLRGNLIIHCRSCHQQWVLGSLLSSVLFTSIFSWACKNDLDGWFFWEHGGLNTSLFLLYFRLLFFKGKNLKEIQQQLPAF